MKRNTDQYLIPVKKKNVLNGTYDINPIHPISEGSIHIGYTTLADRLTEEKTIILDGYIGVDWDEVITSIVPILQNEGLSVSTLNIANCLKSEEVINTMITPYLGGNDPIFGCRTTVDIKDYFGVAKIAGLKPDVKSDIQIIYGTGASQSNMRVS